MAPQAFPSWSNCTTQTAVVAAQQYMTRNFRRPLTLEEVAEHAFVSRHTLSLAFRQNVGMTYKDYLILLRITEAKRLLVTTDAPVSKIGELVGYSNVNNFIKIFRERMHTTRCSTGSPGAGPNKVYHIRRGVSIAKAAQKYAFCYLSRPGHPARAAACPGAGSAALAPPPEGML